MPWSSWRRGLDTSTCPGGLHQHQHLHQVVQRAPVLALLSASNPTEQLGQLIRPANTRELDNRLLSQGTVEVITHQHLCVDRFAALDADELLVRHPAQNVRDTLREHRQIDLPGTGSVEVVHRLIEDMPHPHVHRMLRHQQGNVARPIGIAEPAGQESFKPYADILVLDQCFEKIERAVDPVLPGAQNTSARCPRVGISGAQKSIQQVWLDDVETLGDPQRLEQGAIMIRIR